MYKITPPPISFYILIMSYLIQKYQRKITQEQNKTKIECCKTLIYVFRSPLWF